jgi:hypothetical protein
LWESSRYSCLCCCVQTKCELALLTRPLGCPIMHRTKWPTASTSDFSSLCSLSLSFCSLSSSSCSLFARKRAARAARVSPRIFEFPAGSVCLATMTREGRQAPVKVHWANWTSTFWTPKGVSGGEQHLPCRLRCAQPGQIGREEREERRPARWRYLKCSHSQVDFPSFFAPST